MDDARRKLRLIGVPSSAGAHAPGLERGPAHLREARIHEELCAAGLDVADGGDLPVAEFDPARGGSGARNLAAVLRTVRL
ncbi:MAG: arginase, partial [Micromonosporaceae bacterium]